VADNSPRDFFDKKNKIFLMPGKLVVAESETLISTLLGSCVAVCLHDPLTKIGGMNHYLLPEVLGSEPPSPRYGVFAIPELIREMDKKGADIYQLQAKVFGGGNVLVDNKLGQSIGLRNIAMAEKTLKDAGIWVVRKDVGGERGRKITFDTTTFEVLVSYNSSGEKKTA
jgi:two-component system, chemotaxis family, protein-glutamate methylesterase/glutaminase